MRNRETSGIDDLSVDDQNFVKHMIEMFLDVTTLEKRRLLVGDFHVSDILQEDEPMEA